MPSSGINKRLISALAESISTPFMLLDNSGNMIYSSREADDILNTGSIENIYDLLGNSSAVLFKRMMDSALAGDKIQKTIDLVLRTGVELKLKLSLKKFQDDETSFLILSFQKHQLSVSKEGTAEINLKNRELKDLTGSEEILSIMEEIRELYPFTYIGKEKIRNLANRLSGIFWIRDPEGNFVLVNNKFSESLGLIPEAIEGKQELSFTPSYLTGFQNAVDQYLKNSLQWITSSGFSIHGIKTPGDLVQIPLLDKERNISAVIGFSLPEGEKITKPEDQEYTFTELVRMLPYPVFLTDAEGKIKEGNAFFSSLLSREANFYLNLNYNSVLPAEISQKISLFLDESNEEISFNYFGSFNDDPKSHYIVHLRKFNRGRKNLLVIIGKDIPEEDLEKLINRRGIMFDILIQNNPQPVFIYDRENLRFLEVNDAALKLYGYRRDEFLRMDLTDLYTAEDIQTLLDSSNDAKGAKFSGPYRHKRKDGSSVFVELSKINFKFNDSDAHFNIVRDVSDKLQLLNQNQIFKAAFDNTENLLFVTDASGFITFANRTVQTLLGYSKKDLENTSFAALTTNEARGSINTTIFQATPRDIIVLSLDLKKADGSLIKTEVTATPVVDFKNEITSFTIICKFDRIPGAAPKEIIKEVTKEVIKEVPVEVIKEVIVERNLPVQENAAGQKENLNFFSSLFHDILTPINVILGFVQELTDSVKNLSPEQKESVDIINQNRENLLNIMNSIVEYSSIEKDTIELNIQEIPVTEIIDNIQSEIDPVISARGLEFAYGKISSSLKFKSDKQRMLNFITIIVKMVANISKEKKIYFSAYHVKENEFLLSIKNNYAASTKPLVDTFTAIFSEDESAVAKDYGIPKLNIRLAKALLRKLKGRFELIEKGSSNDYGFIFPIDFASAEEIIPLAPEIPAPAARVTPIHRLTPVEKEQPKEETPETIYEEPETSRAAELDLEDLLSEEELQMESDLSTIETQLSSAKEEERPKPMPPGRIDLSQLSCLYIEDQVDSQILFKVQMKELKEIKFAVSFEEALPLLDHNRFDFIVIDINLQGEYNGMDAMKIIQNMPGYKNVPLIAITAYVLPGDRERFIATGFNDFISKPIFREKMVNSLERIMLMQE